MIARERLLLVGSGAVATALAAALPGCLRWSRRGGGVVPPCDAAILAVSDGAITDVASMIASAVAPAVLLHTAGGVSPRVLAPYAPAVGVCHPLRALRGVVASFAGTVFAVAGDPAAQDVAVAIVKQLDGVVLALAEDALPRYHAAAALAGNHTVALVAAAADELVALGLSRAAAEQALGGLLASAATNIVARGTADGLTGAVARGDVAAVARHLAALDGDALRLYRATLPALVDVAHRGGRITDESRVALLRLLADAE